MFFGDYSFFDYKSNIEGYSGQDYGGPAQYLYLALSAILLVTLLYLFRKMPQEKARKAVGYLGVFLIVFYLAKTTWESYYDVTLMGAFNTCLLPFDTCSVIMPAAVLVGFGKGRIREMAASWCMTWHFLMVFIGLLLVVTERGRFSVSVVKNGFCLHVLISLFVIPVDLLFGFDFMLYRELGGVPFFEDLAAEFTARRLSFLNPPMMLFLYFLGFSLVFGITALFKNVLFQGTGSEVRRRAGLLR